MSGPSETTTLRIVRGSYDDALAHGRALLADNPGAALKQAETLLRGEPEPRALRLAAAACRKLGLPGDAVDAELAAIQAGFKDPELRQAAIAHRDGQLEDAAAIIDHFLARDPDDLLALTLKAEIAIDAADAARSGDFSDPERMLRQVLDRAPTYLRATTLLATALMKQIRMRDAIEVLEAARVRKPNNRDIMVLLVRARVEVGDVEDAVRLYEQLAEAQPDIPDMWVNLGQYQRICGNREEAIAAFRKALETDPYNGSAWWSLANYYADSLSETDEQTIRLGLFERSANRDAGPLNLALGVLEDRAANYQAAFDHFVTGKSQRLAEQPFDPDPITHAVDAVIATLTPALYRKRQKAGWADASPIFIVGMPRSGTTLVERILDQHSAIETTGELQLMPRLADAARFQAGEPDNYASALTLLRDEQLADIGRQYVEGSADYRRTDLPRFIDKNNLNWMQVATILLTLPQAKIVDVRRNAVDCCWANFKMLFGAFPAANDLRHVGRFYRDYARLLDALTVAAPGRILPVRYEDVVDDVEGQAKRITDFLGLAHEPGAADFHKSTKPVATASSEQVRQPINRRGIGSADPYRPWLGPMLDELGPLADA